MIFHISEEPCVELEAIGLTADLSAFPGFYYYVLGSPSDNNEKFDVKFRDNTVIMRTRWGRWFFRVRDTHPFVINNWDTSLPAADEVVFTEDQVTYKQPSFLLDLNNLERNLSLSDAAAKIRDLIRQVLILRLRQQKETAKLYTTGGLDTAVIEAVVRSTSLIDQIEIDRSLHGTKCDPHWSRRGMERRFLLPHHPDLKQIPPHQGTLITGHWGGVAMGRWPGIMRTYAHLDGWDYDEELERHRGSYLYNFLKSPTHRAVDSSIYPGICATTPEQALDHATSVLYHSHEVRDFDDTKLITPFRLPGIHKIVHQLRPELLRDNAFTSSLHMAVIEVCDPSVFDTVDRIKFKSPNG